jgi:hypothetical protein
MFNDNKYKRWYYDIINSAKLKNRSKKDMYYESHHIIPRCMGGGDNSDNLVLLTAREHFIVHLMLVRMVRDEMVYKLVHAIIRFSSGARNAREYALLRATISRFSKGEYNASYGKKWTHNPKTGNIKYIIPSLIEDGYVFGLPHQRGGVASTGIRYIWVNNGKQESMVPFNEKLNDGWVVGKLVTPPLKQMFDMAKKRHTPEKDKEHSLKMTGRTIIKDPITSEIKRVHINELEYYIKLGYINVCECSIRGVKYSHLPQASTSMGINTQSISKRLLSTSEKWVDWFYTNR